MLKPVKCSFVLLLLVLLPFSKATAGELEMPEITAQGFYADQPQKGVLGEYPRLRVRIEAAGRIKELIIKERSYEVDLAVTKDKQNLDFFGLVQNPRSYTDVTLNLQNYINEKIDTVGTYEFHIRVSDKDDNVAEKTISLEVHATRPATETGIGDKARMLQKEPFSLQRVGSGPVEGGPQFGIYWKNKDNVNVAINIIRAENSNTQLSMLDKSDFENIQTVDQLAQRVASLKETEDVLLTTARDKAAGEVFMISRDDLHYILKVMESSAYPSSQGTVVTIKGHYKYWDNAE